MRDKASFDYAILRVVPRVEREEFINAGVILFCLTRNYLAARVCIDEQRLRGLWPDIDIGVIRDRLEAIPVREVQHARVGDVIASLRESGRQHTLVIEGDVSGRPEVCGIFSLTQIEKQLGMAIPPTEIARTFTEIEAALIAD